MDPIEELLQVVLASQCLAQLLVVELPVDLDQADELVLVVHCGVHREYAMQARKLVQEGKWRLLVAAQVHVFVSVVRRVETLDHCVDSVSMQPRGDGRTRS